VDAPPTEPQAAPVLQRRLRTDVLLMLASKGAVLISGIVSSVVIARALGPGGRGTTAVAVSFLLILVQIGSIGFQTANPYFLASHGVPRRAVIANSLWVAGGVGALLFAVAIACRALAPDIVAGLNWLELIMAAAAAPAALAALFLQGILLAEHRMLAYNGIEAGGALFAIAGLVLWEVLVGLSVTSAIFFSISGYAVATAACLIALGRHGPLLGMPQLDLLRRMAGYAVRIYVASLLAYVVVRLDVLLVNGFLGAGEAGFYTLAVGFGDMLYLLPLVVALNLFPRLARGASGETTGEIFRSISVIYAAVVLVAAVFAKPAMTLLYGESFTPAAELFWWLAPGVWCYGVLNILNYHLAARGFPREILLYWTVALLINVAINVALLDSRGTYIASLASSITYAMLLWTHMRLLARELGGWHNLVPRPGEVVTFVRTALRPAPPSGPG
jgi:O-antigen/teichoic acid export membrane protein